MPECYVGKLVWVLEMAKTYIHNQITPISIIWKLCYHHFHQSRNGQFENSVNKISIKTSKKFKNTV